MIVDLARDQHAAGLGEPLQPGRDVDAVAIDVIAVDDDIADIDPDAEHEALVGQCSSASHGFLDRDGAAHGVDRAGELDQHAVAGELHQPAAVAGNQRIDDVTPQPP